MSIVFFYLCGVALAFYVIFRDRLSPERDEY